MYVRVCVCVCVCVCDKTVIKHGRNLINHTISDLLRVKLSLVFIVELEVAVLSDNWL